MQVIWTDFATENLKGIFDYYLNKASYKTAHKIKEQILNSTKQLLNNPESGQLEFNLRKLEQNHRYLVVGNHKINCKVYVNQIIINDVFDTRQNPDSMNDKNRIKK